jgi:hypothetical protein
MDQVESWIRKHAREVRSSFIRAEGVLRSSAPALSVVERRLARVWLVSAVLCSYTIYRL